MGFGYLDFCLQDLEGFVGLFAFGLLALADGFGDGVEHLEWVVYSLALAGGVFVAFDEFAEVSGAYVFFN